MPRKSLSKTLTNSNPETTQPTINPLPPSVQMVIADNFRQLYAQVIRFQNQLLPLVTGEHLANVQRKIEQFEKQRQAMSLELRSARARIQRDTTESLMMDCEELGRELSIQCLMVWDVLLTIAYMEQQKALQPGCWQLTNLLYHCIAEPLGSRIFQRLAAHEGTEQTRLILSRAYSAFQFLKLSPKTSLLWGSGSRTSLRHRTG